MWFEKGVMLWRGHRKGCGPMSSCPGGSAVLSPTPMFWHGDLSASLMAGQRGGPVECWQSAGEPGSQLGTARHTVAVLLRAGCGSCGNGAALFGGTLGAVCGGQLRAVLARCVLLFLSSLWCMWEPWWWAVPHGAEHGREDQLLPQVVGREALVAGDSGTATFLGKGLEPLSVVEPEPAWGGCAPAPAMHTPAPALRLPSHPPPVPCLSPALSLCARAGGEAEAEAGGGRMEGGALQ